MSHSRLSYQGGTASLIPRIPLRALALNIILLFKASINSTDNLEGMPGQGFSTSTKHHQHHRVGAGQETHTKRTKMQSWWWVWGWAQVSLISSCQGICVHSCEDSTLEPPKARHDTAWTFGHWAKGYVLFMPPICTEGRRCSITCFCNTWWKHLDGMLLALDFWLGGYRLHIHLEIYKLHLNIKIHTMQAKQRSCSHFLITVFQSQTLLRPSACLLES